MKPNQRSTIRNLLAGACLLASPGVFAEAGCGAPLPTYNDLKAALAAAVSAETSGFDLQMWATVVNRDGIVCAVAFSGADRGSQWPGSRVISAQKANTANAFSLDGFALSTAELFSAVQPNGSLFGLQESNPVDTTVAYGGNAANFGQKNDPMVGDRIGGINVFGGGLALYTSDHKIIGGVGLSGDTSCADHFIAWRVRHTLVLDYVTNGAAKAFAGDTAHPDNIIFDISPANPTGTSASGFGQPTCFNTGDPAALPPTR
jgi:uncharacterized protein GlcG (DUF336 family)